MAEGRKTCLKPMEVHREYGCRDKLIELVEKEPMFNELFEFIGKELYFKDTVPESIRSQLREEGVSILPVKIHHRISSYGSFYE